MTKTINILCVDRDKIVRSLIENCVAVIEADVTGAESAVEAVSTITSGGKSFDLIFTELLLPHTDGVEFIKQLKQIKVLTHVPIIVISSVTDEEQVVAAMQAGAREYITKPFNSEDLLMRIVSTLGLENRP